MTRYGDILDEVLTQADLAHGITVLATALEIYRKTGLRSGEFPCQRCHAGTVHWSVANNGHGRAACDRKWTDDAGKQHRCTAVMQ